MVLIFKHLRQIALGEKMKQARLICIVTGMLIFLLTSLSIGAVPAFAAEGDEATPVSMGVELRPPPEEALVVPDPPVADYSATASYLPVVAAAVFTLSAASIIIYGKRAKPGRVARVMIMVLALASMPCIAGVVHAAHDYGNPLDTSNIMLFAYYKDPDGWTLANTVPAFESYTDHGNYYDGIVRVWMDKSASNDFVGSEFYVDVCVRVRADGWILAWLTTAQSYVHIVFWGHSIATAAPPVIGATVPSRAIQRVFYVAGKTFPGHDAINYYDFAHPTAKKLLIFGKSCLWSSSSTVTFYYTFPAYVQILDAGASFAYQETRSDNYGYIKIDDDMFASFASSTYWTSASLPSGARTLETKHAVALYSYIYSNSYTRINLALIFWLQ